MKKYHYHITVGDVSPLEYKRIAKLEKLKITEIDLEGEGIDRMFTGYAESFQEASTGLEGVRMKHPTNIRRCKIEEVLKELPDQYDESVCYYESHIKVAYSDDLPEIKGLKKSKNVRQDKTIFYTGRAHSTDELKELKALIRSVGPYKAIQNEVCLFDSEE